MYYVMYCEDGLDSFEKRRSVRQAHLAHLADLQRDNRLLLAGPLFHPEATDVTPFAANGSLIIADFADIEAAKAWIAADPYATAEVYAKITVRPFTKVLP